MGKEPKLLPHLYDGYFEDITLVLVTSSYTYSLVAVLVF